MKWVFSSSSRNSENRRGYCHKSCADLRRVRSNPGIGDFPALHVHSSPGITRVQSKLDLVSKTGNMHHDYYNVYCPLLQVLMNKELSLPEETDHLVCMVRSGQPVNGIICLALAHNEEHILEQFFNHYRAMGVSSFVIINDHSTDQTGAILKRQPDVTIYQPKPGSTYKKDKVAWRCDLLDLSADGHWVLLPDIDEHFIFPDMEQKGLGAFVAELEEEGACAVFTIMVDMYADKPLKDHRYKSGELSTQFPYFDDPSQTALGYRLLPPATRFLNRYPTPPLCAYGGVRDRMFFSQQKSLEGFSGWLLKQFSNLQRPLEPGFYDRVINRFTRKMTKNLFGSDPFSMTKLGLMKWQKGMVLSGGPHAVSGRHKLSTGTAAFLHYKFTRGLAGLEYVADRGQHAGGSLLYQKMLDRKDLFEQSPVFEHSIKFRDSRSLVECGLIRPNL